MCVACCACVYENVPAHRVHAHCSRLANKCNSNGRVRPVDVLFEGTILVATTPTSHVDVTIDAG